MDNCVQVPWSHKPMSLNGRLGNSKIGGCKEIRQPFANPSPTPRQPFANPSPTFRQPLPTFSASPSPTPSFRGPQAPVQRHGLTVSWKYFKPPFAEPPPFRLSPVFRRFSLFCLQIFAFPGNCSISEAQIFAGNRRFSKKTADFRRNPFVPCSLSL